MGVTLVVVKAVQQKIKEDGTKLLTRSINDCSVNLLVICAMAAVVAVWQHLMHSTEHVYAKCLLVFDELIFLEVDATCVDARVRISTTMQYLVMI